jgi:hypothetical protein
MSMALTYQRLPNGISQLDATIDRFRTLVANRFDWCIRVMSRGAVRQRKAIKDATALIREVCALAGAASLIDDTRILLARAGVIDAVRRHDDAVLIEWLIDLLSYQGVSDAIAYGYMEQHGRISAAEIELGLKRQRLCPKLNSYWQFYECGYRKAEHVCSQLEHIQHCPLPWHNLRNGRLNQTAYSLFLFCRDVAEGDVVGWIDSRLARVDAGPARDRGKRLAAAVVEPMTHVYGVSDKVVNMTLSMLLLAGDPDRERWQTAGSAMIAIDTLVHNWLHRTGILKQLGAQHLYGPHCYANDGCADIIRNASRRIDAHGINAQFPSNFPRFVQYAIWTFCSQEGVGQCNGNRINDRERCELEDCALFRRCGRVTLHRPAALATTS